MSANSRENARFLRHRRPAERNQVALREPRILAPCFATLIFFADTVSLLPEPPCLAS
jgi:hypothetical protein